MVGGGGDGGGWRPAIGVIGHGVAAAAVGRGRGVAVSPTLRVRAGAYGTEPGVRAVIRARRR